MAMDDIGILKNQIQEYSWGSRTALAALMGNPEPASNPQAELWMGAHPKAPSKVHCNNQWVSLLELIEKFPDKILGRHVASRFNNRLPFLFKILAADQPLSIQAHPDLSQAQEGFTRENGKGIPLNAFQRNYKDNNHKPEIICPLTPFWALNGFRPIRAILKTLDRVDSSDLQQIREHLRSQPNSKGLKTCFKALFNIPNVRLQHVVFEIVTFAHSHEDEDPLFRWLVRLNELYPGDIGVLCAMLLNLVCLRPGEAMFLPARQLHAYLDGVGIELMANSDNVLRGGLTCKHVDIPELLRVLSFTETKIKKIRPTKAAPAERIYRSKTDEFTLSKIAVNKKTPYVSARSRSVEILVCIKGTADIVNVASGGTLQLESGMSVIVPACLLQYKIKGYATLYKAAVPS